MLEVQLKSIIKRVTAESVSSQDLMESDQENRKRAEDHQGPQNSNKVEGKALDNDTKSTDQFEIVQVAQAADQSLKTLSFRDSLHKNSDLGSFIERRHIQNGEGLGGVSGMKESINRTSTIMVADQSVRGSVTGQTTVGQMEIESPLIFTQRNNDLYPSQEKVAGTAANASEARFKIIKTQNMELLLQSRGAAAQEGGANQDTSTARHESQEGLTASALTWHSKKLTPITDHFRRSRLKQQIVYTSRKQQPPVTKAKGHRTGFNQFSPRQVNLHQQVRLYPTVGQQHAKRKSFPLRQKRRETRAQVLSKSFARGGLGVGSNDTDKVALSMSSDSRSPGRSRPDVGETKGSVTQRGEAPGLLQSRRPSIPGGFQSRKLRQNQPLNVQIRSRTLPFHVFDERRTDLLQAVQQRQTEAQMALVGESARRSKGTQELRTGGFSSYRAGTEELDEDGLAYRDARNYIHSQHRANGEINASERGRQANKTGSPSAFHGLIHQQDGGIETEAIVSDFQQTLNMKQQEHQAVTKFDVQRFQPSPLENTMKPVHQESEDSRPPVAQMTDTQLVRVMSSGQTRQGQISEVDERSSVMIVAATNDNTSLEEALIATPKNAMARKTASSSFERRQEQNGGLEVTITKIGLASPESGEQTRSTEKEGQEVGRLSTPLEQPEVVQTAKIVTIKPGGVKEDLIDRGKVEPPQIATHRSVDTDQSGSKGRRNMAKSQVVWSPKDPNTRATSDSWRRPDMIDYANARPKQGLPKMSPDAFQTSQRRSIYTQDKARMQNLFTNMQRINQMLDHSRGLSETQQQRLPEDRSVHVQRRNNLPSTLKPKALRRELDNLTLGQLALMPITTQDQKQSAFKRLDSIQSPTTQRTKAQESKPQVQEAAPQLPPQSRALLKLERQVKRGNRTPNVYTRRPGGPEPSDFHKSARVRGATGHLQTRPTAGTVNNSTLPQASQVGASTSFQQSSNVCSPPEITTAAGTIINYANLVDGKQRAYSRMQQKQIEDLRVLRERGGCERSISPSVLGTVNGLENSTDQQLPEVVTKVKEWLSNQENDLVLSKHQEVAHQRPTNAQHYMGKQFLDNPRLLRVDVGKASFKPFSIDPAYTKYDTLQLQQHGTIKNEGSMSRLAIRSRFKQTSPPFDGGPFHQDPFLTQQSVFESSFEFSKDQRTAAPRTMTHRAAVAAAQRHFMNASLEVPELRAISPKLKKNLLINLPAPTTQQDRRPLIHHDVGDSIKESFAHHPSRTGISIAPTIEAQSNADIDNEASEDRSGVYRQNGLAFCDRQVTLQGTGLSEASSPARLSRFNKQKPAYEHGAFTTASEYTQDGAGDYTKAISVVSQRMPVHNKNPSRPQKPKITVPTLKGIPAGGGTKGLMKQVATQLNGQNASTPISQRDEDSSTPAPAFDAASRDKDQIPHSMRSNVPGEDDQHTMMPAPLITGRLGLIDSSKDQLESSPSHFQSMEQTIREQILARNQQTVNHEVQSIDSDRKILLNCLKQDTVAVGTATSSINEKHRKDTAVLTRLLKGQSPLSSIKGNSCMSSAQRQASVNCGDLINLADVSFIRKVELEADKEVLISKVETSTLLFQLRTRYRTQERAWLKYDEQWALFEKDHLKAQCPVPISAQFLLVHLIDKLRSQARYKRLSRATQLNDHDRLASCSSPDSTASHHKRGGRKTTTPDTIMASTGMLSPSEQRSMSRGVRRLGDFLKGKASMSPGPNKELKIPGSDRVSLEVLEEAYKQARIRLQMSSASILRKYNDDNRCIFTDYKLQLTETYDRIKESSTLAPVTPLLL